MRFLKFLFGLPHQAIGLFAASLRSVALLALFAALGMPSAHAVSLLRDLTVNGVSIPVDTNMIYQVPPGTTGITLVGQGPNITSKITYTTATETKTVTSMGSANFTLYYTPHLQFDITVQNIQNGATSTHKLWVYEPPMPGDEATFTTAKTITTSRRKFGSSILANGCVFVTGGLTWGGSSNLTTTEIYDPATNTWTYGPAFQGRNEHSQTTLTDGRVLVAGGINNSAPIATAQIFDPATNTWSDTGSLETARSEHLAVLLQDGRVLVVGGKSSTGTSLDSAEIFDPTTGAWTAAGTMNTGRVNHTATLLQDGRVLVVGGGGASPAPAAEIFDPTSGQWIATAPMSLRREDHMAARLHDGRVLIAGGYAMPQTLDHAEIFNPVTGTWQIGFPMCRQRRWASATVLPNGQVFVVGGYGNADKDGHRYLRAECYSPFTGNWNPSLYSEEDSIFPAHDLTSHRSLLLNDGRVMILDEVPLASKTILATFKSAEVQVKVGDVIIPTGGGVDFGTLVVGSEGTRTLTFTNTSAAEIRLTGLPKGSTASGIPATLTIDSPTNLLPGESTTGTFKFKPTERLTATGAARLKTTDEEGIPFFIGAYAQVITGFEAWAASQPGIPSGFANAGDAPHGDGVANLLKFAFNLAPDRADARPLTDGGLAGLPKVGLVSSPTKKIRLEYLRRKDSGLTYTPQFGTRLDNFAPITESPVVTPIDETWERVVVEKPVTTPTGFARVKVADS
jgi:hypothetical protein